LERLSLALLQTVEFNRTSRPVLKNDSLTTQRKMAQALILAEQVALAVPSNILLVDVFVFAILQPPYSQSAYKVKG